MRNCIYLRLKDPEKHRMSRNYPLPNRSFFKYNYKCNYQSIVTPLHMILLYRNIEIIWIHGRTMHLRLEKYKHNPA